MKIKTTGSIMVADHQKEPLKGYQELLYPQNMTSQQVRENNNILFKQSQISKARTKREKYMKIDQGLRLELVTLVIKEGMTVKEASQQLDLKFSTSKAIVKLFKGEGRLFQNFKHKKNSQEKKTKPVASHKTKAKVQECSAINEICQDNVIQPIPITIVKQPVFLEPQLINFPPYHPHYSQQLNMEFYQQTYFTQPQQYYYTPQYIQSYHLLMNQQQAYSYSNNNNLNMVLLQNIVRQMSQFYGASSRGHSL